MTSEPDPEFEKRSRHEEDRQREMAELKRQIAELETQESLHLGAGNRTGAKYVRDALRDTRKKLYRLEHEYD